MSFRCFFCKCQVFSCLHLRDIWVWPHRHKNRWCCSDVCVGFSHLHVWSWNSTYHQVLGRQSRQGSSPSIAQFGWATSSWKSPERPFFQLRIMEATVTSVNQIFFLPSSDMCLDTILSLELCWQFLPPHGLFFALWYPLSAVRPFIERWVSFLIMSNQYNLPRVDSNHGVETSQQWEMRGTGGKFNMF